MEKEFTGNLSIEEGTSRVFTSGSLAERLLIDNETRLTRTDFSKVLETENTGTLYVVDGEYTEDGSMVYYYAGNALNNWVKFGKDQNGSDLYWRIIRTNEDGGVRLLYAGTTTDTEAGYIAQQVYNNTKDNTMYVGYMYGESGSLYETTQAVEDKFSVSESSGENGKLTYPVALMTADEVAFAGGAMSPYFTNSNSNAVVYNTSCIVYHSLSLKSCVQYVTGNGSSSTPYEVTLSDTCINSEN